MDCGIDTYPLLTSRQDEIITIAKRRRARNISIFGSPEAYPLKDPARGEAFMKDGRRRAPGILAHHYSAIARTP